MPEKVAKVGVRKRAGYRCYVDSKGNVVEEDSKGRGKVIAKPYIKKLDGYFYYIDKNGDVSRVELERIEEYPEIKEEYNEGMLGIEEAKKKRIEREERTRIKEQKMRYEIRKKILLEEFGEEMQTNRVPIPEEVRHEVWRRDSGKCVKCGSRENLEFDHIIPISKGGGNTARNIELLCEKCNREKSNNIG